MGPWRGKHLVFKWDGLHFLFSALEMDPPVYRFQAVQDADRFFLMGDYDLALAGYLSVISDDDLDWWSLERKLHIVWNYHEASPEPEPLPDPDEHPALAAYARYRIVLLYAQMGIAEAARASMDELRNNHPTNTSDAVFTEMAELFWAQFLANGDMQAACAPVIAFAQDHPEVFTYIGNGDYQFGLQSHRYVPEDLCPLPR